MINRKRWFDRKLPSDPKDLPKFVFGAAKYLEKNGVIVDGLFRVHSSKELDSKAKEEIEKSSSGNLNFSKYPVHTTASMLKLYLENLPEPLFTYEQYRVFVKASVIPEGEERINTIRAVILLLPLTNQMLLKELSKLLSVIANNYELTKMNSTNLAIIFSSNLLLTEAPQTFQESMKESQYATSLMKTLIEESGRIFEANDGEHEDVEDAEILLFSKKKKRNMSLFSKLVKGKW
ncbi:Rho GTPase-activating protein [Acrasis kona]|uniref:Rho GTPase-activating protein n=1 Tax=Acrasis kona TaxID=1008807 RepID=A0AAW2Z728_9EUKA